MAVGAAIGVSAMVGAGASYMAAKEQSKAADKAARVSQAQYMQTREDQAPWRIAGEKALRTIQDMPEFQFNAQSFEQMRDPSYEFRQQEGINALDRSAAARGRVLSGAQDRAVTRYGSELASQEYGNAFNRAMATYQQQLGRQQSLAGIGQQATNVISQAVQQAAWQQANIAMQQGQAQANMYTGVAQSVNQGIGNYLLYSQSQPTPTPKTTTAGG